MQVFDEQIVEFEGQALAWGITLAAAAATLSSTERLPTYGGWPERRYRCQSAYGLATTECSLRAPALHKPVLQASYTLVPPPFEGVYTIDAAYWLQPLTKLLGPPTEAGQLAEGGRYSSSNVVQWARWQRPYLLISLSLYGGLRHEEGRTHAAGLFLDWQDEVTAARPFRAAAEAQAAALAAVAGQVTDMQIFHFQQTQADVESPSPDSQLPEAALLRASKRALYQEGLCDTPAHLQPRLTEYQIGLWPVPGQAAWAVSTRQDTVLLTASGPAVELWTTRRGRGPGSVSLKVGGLMLLDAEATKTLAQLADAIEQLTGRPVNRLEDENS